MRYKILRQLRKPSGRIVVEVDAPAPPGTGAETVGNIVGEVELTNTGRQVAARGHLAGKAKLHCSRCLREVEWPLDVRFVETCTLNQIDDPAQYQADEDEDDPIPILDEDAVDLSELVRQLVVMELPYHPLCRPDCAGLCPECGADLNEGECGCTARNG
jgi:DUF177 domain-containing protein